MLYIAHHEKLPHLRCSPHNLRSASTKLRFLISNIYFSGIYVAVTFCFFHIFLKTITKLVLLDKTLHNKINRIVLWPVLSQISLHNRAVWSGSTLLIVLYPITYNLIVYTGRLSPLRPCATKSLTTINTITDYILSIIMWQITP